MGSSHGAVTCWRMEGQKGKPAPSSPAVHYCLTVFFFFSFGVFIVLCLFIFFQTPLPYNSGYPEISFVEQTDLELTETHLPLPGLKACATRLSSLLLIISCVYEGDVLRSRLHSSEGLAYELSLWANTRRNTDFEFYIEI